MNDIDYYSSDIRLNKTYLCNFINLNQDDSQLVLRWRNNSEIRKWMYNDKIITYDEHKNFIEGLREDKKKLYWLVYDENEIEIGVIYLQNINIEESSAYLGIYLDPENTRLRSGMLLMDSIVEISYSKLNIRKIKLEVIEDNVRAINFYTKYGFVEEGRIKNKISRSGEKKDAIIMGRLNKNEK